MARAAALMWAVGGVLAIAAAVLPHSRQLNEPAVLVTGFAACVAAVAYLTWREKLPWPVLGVTPVVSILVITLLVHFGGGRVVSASFSMLYVWVALYVAYFLSRPALVGHMAVAHTAHALVLIGHPTENAPFTIWLFAAGTSVVVGSMVSHLVGSLRGQARLDGLTGLLNRRAWDETLGQELYRARREGRPVSVAIVDMDHFKRMNDRWGHQFGDALLRRVAAAWSDALRATDSLGRFGGDEFALVFPDTRAQEAVGVMERLRDVLPAGLSVSVGVAEWDGWEAPEDLLRRADAALYEVKEAGRGATRIAEYESIPVT